MGHAPRDCLCLGNFPGPEVYPDSVTAVAGPPVSAPIHMSNDNTKCATVSVRVFCADDAGHWGNRLTPIKQVVMCRVERWGRISCHAHRLVAKGMHLEISRVAASVGHATPFACMAYKLQFIYGK